GKGYDPQKRDYTELVSWMQCYSVEGMNSARDHNGRTIWFKGVPGPMAPKASKSQKAKRKIKKGDNTDTKKEKLEEKEAGAGKRVKDVANKRGNARQQKARKSGPEGDDRKKPNTRSSTGLQQTKAETTRRQKANTKAKATSKPRKKSSRTA
ncbi:endonuclease 8-like 1, partial [Tachysurus ichikawai]